MIAIVLLPILFVFMTSNAEFFDTVEKEKEQGYEWHYVGPTTRDPNAKSLSIQPLDQDGKPLGEPYILWKLK